MIQWPEDIKVYLHREPVDFRKAINGLSVIVQHEMALSPFDAALFVFCNKKRTQLKMMKALTLNWSLMRVGVYPPPKTPP